MGDDTRHPSIVVAIGAARVMLTVLVVYAFLTILMTASAQQSISASLREVKDEDGKPVTYSQAYLAYKQSKKIEIARAEARKTYDKERATLLQAESASADIEPALMAEGDAFFSLYKRLLSQGLCDFSADANRMQMWEATSACVGEMKPRDQDTWRALLARTPNFKALLDKSGRADSLRAQAYRNVQDAKEAMEIAAKDGDWALSVARKFGDFDLLRGSWMAAGGLFEGFPPATLQILLAFMSGAFGALLIAQILIVYPENQLGLTKGEGFEARIGLGGMVAVCVYIILGSGAVLLGDASSLEGDANVMTFAGVGVLAGMFSDRVAAWLSERANFFFEARRKPGEDAGDGDEPADDKPRPSGKTPPGTPEKRART